MKKAIQPILYLYVLPITMNAIDRYINDSCLAASKLISALSSFEQEILNSISLITKTINPAEQTKQMENIHSRFVPRDAIAGALLQISFMCMRHYPKQGIKNETVLFIEEQIKVNTGRAYTYPIDYCVGRQILGIPIGLLIFVARNQYNHQDESVNNLQYYNRVIFEVLNCSIGNVDTTGIGFDLHSKNPTMFAYSMITLLGWTYTLQTPNPISTFRIDLRNIVGMNY